MEAKSYVGVPTLSVANGATTPNPGYPAIVYSPTMVSLGYWNGSKWQSAANNAYIALAANQTVNSAAFANVTGFSVPVGANETWLIDCNFTASVNAAPDIAFQLVTPAGSSGRYGTAAIVAGAVGIGIAGPVATAPGVMALATGNEILTISGAITTIAAGTISVQVRNGAGAVAQTLFAGSWMRAERIS